MADPTDITLTENTWVKVAENVTAGIVDLTTTQTTYLQTYVMTGNPAPTARADGRPFIGQQMQISATAAIDVYMFAIGTAGEVSVSL